MKQVQPFKGFPPIDLGGEFIHGSNTVVNKIARENGWVVLPVSQIYLSMNNSKYSTSILIQIPHSDWLMYLLSISSYIAKKNQVFDQ